MESTDEMKCIGYIKYFGDGVEQGLLDSRKAAEALLGFDEAIRFYMSKEEPLLRNVDFDFPVAINKGSWKIAIPDNIDTLITLTGSSLLLGKYLCTLAEKSAKDGLLESGPVKDLKKTVAFAIKAIQWTINISKKIGKVGVLDYDKVRLIDSETVEISDDLGFLVVPMSFYKLYQETPKTLFTKSASVIDSGRELEVGLYESENQVVATVVNEEKSIFNISVDDANEIVLPELEHDQYVELEGLITRCTATANTIGFLYKGHILTCKPASGSLSSFKSCIIAPTSDQFFRSAKIRGTVVRRSVDGEFKEMKPHIVFTDIIPLTKQYQPLLSLTTQGKVDSEDDD